MLSFSISQLQLQTPTSEPKTVRTEGITDLNGFPWSNSAKSTTDWETVFVLIVRFWLKELLPQINVQFVVQTEVCGRAGVFVFYSLLCTDLQTLSHLVRPITIGEQISSCDLMIRDRLSLSQQGQIDVTRVKSCRQTAHTKTSRIRVYFLNQSDSGSYWRVNKQKKNDITYDINPLNIYIEREIQCMVTSPFSLSCPLFRYFLSVEMQRGWTIVWRHL